MLAKVSQLSAVINFAASDTRLLLAADGAGGGGRTRSRTSPPGPLLSSYFRAGTTKTNPDGSSAESVRRTGTAPFALLYRGNDTFVRKGSRTQEFPLRLPPISQVTA